MIRRLVVLFVWAVPLVAAVLAVTPGHSASIDFRASYVRIVDGEDFFGPEIDLVIEDATMSGDGSTVVFYGRQSDTNEKKIYLVDADGSNLTGILLPTDPDNSAEQILPADLAISRDGSRAFFVTPWTQHRIYKVESGTISEILDTNDWVDITPSVARPLVRTTWDGQYAYFKEDRQDIWRVHHTGGTPSLVVDDEAVLRNGGLKGWAVATFDVSDDGSQIAFTLMGYWEPPPGVLVTITDLFSKADGQDCGLGDQCQLTLDTNIEDYPAISGDGSTIAFNNGVSWFSIDPDGSDSTELEPRGFNVGGNTLTLLGDRMFYYDTEAGGGRLTQTDGTGGLDLFPAWDVNNIAIASTWDPVISNDGSRVCFRHDLLSLYVGDLNPVAPVSPAPIIHNMVFDPPYMPNDDPAARVILTSQVSDPQGLSDVEETATDELLEGMLENNSNILPMYFNIPAHDDGVYPDAAAGDGVFSTEGQPAGGIQDHDSVTIRMGAMDSDRNVTVADAVLYVSAVPPEVFADGFESGYLSQWSAVIP
ncbi:MAG: choice-of-anchor X domain-containing protein [Thermoanaerobaculia bacterium]